MDCVPLLAQFKMAADLRERVVLGFSGKIFIHAKNITCLDTFPLDTAHVYIPFVFEEMAFSVKRYFVILSILLFSFTKSVGLILY